MYELESEKTKLHGIKERALQRRDYEEVPGLQF